MVVKDLRIAHVLYTTFESSSIVGFLGRLVSNVSHQDLNVIVVVTPLTIFMFKGPGYGLHDIVVETLSPGR